MSSAPRAAVAAGLAIVCVAAAPVASGQENLGDNGPEDTFFSFTFDRGQKLGTSMSVTTSIVAGPQAPDADLEFSDGVYAVSLSYGVEQGTTKRLRKALVVRADSGTAGRTRTVTIRLGIRQVRSLRAAARRSGRRSVLVVAEGVARRVDGGEPGIVKRGTRLLIEG
jgi:hypothetical protein